MPEIKLVFFSFRRNTFKFIAELTKSNYYKYEPDEYLDKDTIYIVQAHQSDNNEHEFVENLDKNSTYMVISSSTLFMLCIIGIAIFCIRSYDIWQPLNAIFVNKVDKTSSETKRKGFDNIFSSGY
jgi:hypothetical protein